MSKIGKYLALKPWRREAITASFLSRISIGRNRWIWTGPQNGKGYGCMNFRFRGGAEGAHRISYFLHHGEIPDGLVVMHLCDNPLCVNPSHLKTGTSAENTKDAAAKGRLSRQHGSKSGKAKITEGLALQAMRLIAAGLPFKQAAEKYGVSHFTLRRIEDGSRWPHIQKTVREIFSAGRPINPGRSHPWRKAA